MTGTAGGHLERSVGRRARPLSDRQSKGRETLVGTLILAACVVVVWSYWPGLSGGLYFDDLPNIVDAPALHWEGPTWEEFWAGVSGARNPHRVVANATFGLNHAFGGLEPRGYHVVNLVIHLLVGMVLMWVAWLYGRVSGSGGGGFAAPVAVVSALLFLVHPLGIQSVTYVVQRMSSLAALFGLLAFGAYLAGRREAAGGTRWWFVLAGVSWLLAVGSKETALMLPVVVLAWELCFHGPAWRHRWVGWWSTGRDRWLLMLVVAAAVGVVWLLSELYLGSGSVGWRETFPGREFSGWERVLTQGRVQLLYLSLLLWPAPGRLNLDHEFVVSRSWLEPATLGALVFWLAMGVAVVWLARRRPRYGFPLLAYLLLHAVESGPLNLELVFEHRMYLPMAFLTLLVMVLLTESSRRWGWPVLTVALVVAIPLAGATHGRNFTWADTIRLHQDCARKSPGKFRPQYNLGTVLGQLGQYVEAVAALRKAVALEPDSSKAHNHLGAVYWSLNLPDRAIGEYRAAVRLGPDNAQALYNLAAVLDSRGETGEAVGLYRRFLDIAPSTLASSREQVRRRLASMTALAQSSDGERGGGARGEETRQEEQPP